jgi:Domain of unknown function (DUF4112)
MDEPTPQYLPREHVELFRRHRALTRLSDQAFRVPGTDWRFGWDALLGVFPGAGDLLGAGFAGYGVVLARRMGVPAAVQLRMIGNVAIDVALGAVPLVGDLFDAAFKAQLRNHRLLERWLESPRKVERASRLALIAVPAAALLVLVGVVALAGAALYLVADSLSM